MDKGVLLNVFNDFYSGKISDLRKEKNTIIFKIEMWDYDNNCSKFFISKLIKCAEFSLRFRNGRVIKDLNELKKYEIEMKDTELINNTLVVKCNVDKINDATILLETETVKVFDELNKEISLLNLSIFSGLCSDGVGLDFFIGNSLKETESLVRYVKFNEELQHYLQIKEQFGKRYKEKRPKRDVDLLIGLDQYGDKIFSVQEIKQLVIICGDLVNTYSTDNLTEQKIRYFAQKLKELCEEALEKKKLIVAIGD